MAKMENGILDVCRGKVGTVVAYTWRGKACMRSLPVAPQRKATAAQAGARALFSEAVRLGGSMKELLRMGLHERSLAEGMTECNLFCRLNRGRFALGADGLTVDWARLAVADGPVEPAVAEEVVAGADGRVTVLTAPGAGQMGLCPADWVTLYAYCPARREGLMAAPARRDAWHATLQLPQRWSGSEVQLYLVVRDWRDRVSPGTWAGSVVAP